MFLLMNTITYFVLVIPLVRVAATSSVSSARLLNFLISQTRSSALVANPYVTSPDFPNKDSNPMPSSAVSTLLPHMVFQKAEFQANI